MISVQWRDVSIVRIWYLIEFFLSSSMFDRRPAGDPGSLGRCVSKSLPQPWIQSIFLSKNHQKWQKIFKFLKTDHSDQNIVNILSCRGDPTANTGKFIAVDILRITTQLVYFSSALFDNLMIKVIFFVNVNLVLVCRWSRQLLPMRVQLFILNLAPVHHSLEWNHTLLRSVDGCADRA